MRGRSASRSLVGYKLAYMKRVLIPSISIEKKSGAYLKATMT